MPLSGDKFTRPLGPNSSIGNQIQTGTTILAANIRRQTKMFLKGRVKTKTLAIPHNIFKPANISSTKRGIRKRNQSSALRDVADA
ncbi:hypothetical protein F2Q70_00014661 [Brassica cretica]|uniref:Uncharacterized protein n=2 Tax=Brassica cretica TaxID=69181 RepID=A0A8S9HE31_BRACR|nr:hypothetical protein F2Q68_00015776 [Brassica cretica]KAF2564104.1 hypothetical protein F2Q70_00014661 [Brassica cretica]KAF3532502.1 hypothetical protein DY000_02039167 [Brassica cretica]